jgi:hypothetical protein
MWRDTPLWTATLDNMENVSDVSIRHLSPNNSNHLFELAHGGRLPAKILPCPWSSSMHQHSYKKASLFELVAPGIGRPGL